MTSLATAATDALDPAQALSDRHFVMQAQRPAMLAGVRIRALAPELRMLLCTDGTVTRALEMYALRRASVAVVDEGDSAVPRELLPCLRVAAGTRATVRRVLIATAGAEAPVVYAESWIVFSRLPAGFSSLLGDSPQGIGQALAAGRLESRRELLWYGLGEAPGWGSTDVTTEASPTLVRTYRVVCDGRVALVISEHFAIEDVAGRRYRLRDGHMH